MVRNDYKTRFFFKVLNSLGGIDRDRTKSKFCGVENRKFSMSSFVNGVISLELQAYLTYSRAIEGIGRVARKSSKRSFINSECWKTFKILKMLENSRYSKTQNIEKLNTQNTLNHYSKARTGRKFENIKNSERTSPKSRKTSGFKPLARNFLNTRKLDSLETLKYSQNRSILT